MTRLRTTRLQNLAIATLVGLLSVPVMWSSAMAGEVSPGLHKVLKAAEAEAAGAEVAVPDAHLLHLAIERHADQQRDLAAEVGSLLELAVEAVGGRAHHRRPRA